MEEVPWTYCGVTYLLTVEIEETIAGNDVSMGTDEDLMDEGDRKQDDGTKQAEGENIRRSSGQQPKVAEDSGYKGKSMTSSAPMAGLVFGSFEVTSPPSRRWGD